ncbi:MAG: hypothetical protein ACYTGL_13835 [Planctomycetota bacterium]|jgi:hypothetical protein
MAKNTKAASPLPAMDLFEKHAGIRYGGKLIDGHLIQFASMTALDRETLVDGWMLDEAGEYIEDRRRRYKLRVIQLCLVERGDQGVRYLFADKAGKFDDEIPDAILGLDSGVMNQIADAVLAHVKFSPADQATLEKK